MIYQTFPSQTDLSSFVKCYWTLEVPADMAHEKQRIIPDGCIEMAFILGDDIKRYTSDSEYTLQPRAMVIGQINEPFYIEPTGYVNTFAVRFYPHGFANFVNIPLHSLENKETPLQLLFGEQEADELEVIVISASSTEERITIMYDFLLQQLHKKSTIDVIVKTTIDALLATKGSMPINTILKDDLSKRRQLERNFIKQVGVSPKQLGKVIRLQAALKMLLNQKDESLTRIAYESEYYDQNHFIKDFKEFTGTTPGDFLSDETLKLSSIFYTKE